jgi:hypothetical protein
MSEQQQTREPKIPGQVPTGYQELSAPGASAIYELSGTGSNESGSELSSVPTPSELPVPEISSIGSWENLIHMPLQQKGDSDGKGNPKGRPDERDSEYIGTAVMAPPSYRGSGPFGSLRFLRVLPADGASSSCFSLLIYYDVLEGFVAQWLPCCQ